MARARATSEQALWYVAAGRAELREAEAVAAGSGYVQVRALFGAISRGTERLVFHGRVPESEFERMRAPFMGGSFPFPVKYGYATVGRLEDGPAQDQLVFALHPHQTSFTIPAEAVHPIPPAVPVARAVLAANMETALNAVWDGAPGPADRIVIVGAGIVGLLVARLCARLHGAEVTVIDIAPDRARFADSLGLAFRTPDAAPADCDLVFHASSNADGLATALRCAGDEAAVIELSWYGTGMVAAPLGDAFHSRRLRLVSSQVGKVSPSHRPRWTPARRLRAALALLDDPGLDILLAPAVDFTELPSRLPELLAPDGDARCVLIRYPGAV